MNTIGTAEEEKSTNLKNSELGDSQAENWSPNKLTKKDVKFATWIAFIAWVLAVYDFILFGTLLPQMGTSYGWSEIEQAQIATWVAVGGAIVAFIIGPIVDRMGRKPGLIFTVGGAGLCSLFTAFGASAGKGPLTVIRSIAGLGYAEQTVNATYLTEMYSAVDDPELQKKKGFIYSLVQGGWPIGALVASGITAILLPIVGWQGNFIFAAIPSFILIFFAIKLKETPQFQVHKRIRELRDAGHETNAKELAVKYNVDYSEHQSAGIKAAFQGNALRATLVLGGAVLLNWFAIQIFSVLGTTVLTRVHGVSFESSLIILVASNLLGYLGYMTHGWLGDRIGRRNTIAIGWVLGGIAFSGMLFGPSNQMAVIAMYSLGLFFLIGPYAAALFFISESFPTSIRATAGAIVNAMGPVGAILASLGSTAILSNGGDWQMSAFLFGSIPCFLSGLMILLARHVDPATVK